jgi:hypothetical protein
MFVFTDIGFWIMDFINDIGLLKLKLTGTGFLDLSWILDTDGFPWTLE